MGKIVDRIGKYAESKNISIRKIEQEIGASNGTLSKAIGKGKDILAEWVALFVKNFPDANPVWLITGEGDMLLEPDFSTEGENAIEGNLQEVIYKTKIRHLEELLKLQIEKNKLLEDIIEQLKSK